LLGAIFEQGGIMSLRQETRQDLKAELERLEKRAVAIRQILGEEEQPLAADTSAGAQSKNNGGSGTRTGLRKWIRDAVVAKPGLRPAEVARRIEAAGFRSDAKTALVTRVHNETRRMAVAGGSLKKRNGKLYPNDREGGGAMEGAAGS
jgi:hypothetical protein